MPDSGNSLLKSLENARDIVLTCDPDGGITYANKSAHSKLRPDSGELVGANFLEVVEELSRYLAANLFQYENIIEGWHAELLLQGNEGKVFPAFVSASPILNDTRGLESVLLISQDITERKKYEEDIRKRADFANSLIRSAPIGILTLGADRTIKTINAAFSEMLGSPAPNSLINQPFEKISGFFDPPLLKPIAEGLRGIETRVYNRPLTHDDAREITVGMITMPLRDPAGNVEGVCILVENRTDLVKAEEQLLQADKLAATGFLAAGIAHEINNPLAGMRSIIEMLAGRVKREGGNSEPYHHLLGNIDRITDIIKRLLEYANPTGIQESVANLNNLTKQIMDFFKFHRLYRDVEVVWDLDENLPVINVDAKQVQQIIHNLAMNAAQAMKEEGGRLEIMTRYIEASQDGQQSQVQLIMRDTGPGIEDKNLRRIFDPFFTTKPPGVGTGLGLSVSHSIAKNHGGSLTARNHPDGGAEFTLILPIT